MTRSRAILPLVGLKVTEPVLNAVPAMNDEFAGPLSLAWQWHANPQDDWMSLTDAPGLLRLKSISSSPNLYEAGNLLTQKFPGPVFNVDTRLVFSPLREGEQAGLLVIGTDYTWIGLRKTVDGLRVVRHSRSAAAQNAKAEEILSQDVVSNQIYLRARVDPLSSDVPPPNKPHWPSELKMLRAQVRLSYSTDGVRYVDLGAQPFSVDPGRWVGATIGLFSSAPAGTPAFVATSVGFADFDYFRITAASTP